jgi:TP901 family phage tail tape measure protein
MAEDAGSVYSEVRIHLDQLDNDLKGVYSRLDQMESRIKSQTSTASKTATKSFDAMSVAGVAAFLGVGNAIKSTASIYSDFSQSMSNVAAVSNATGAQLQELTDAAKNAGATTKYTASQAADALFNLAQAGMSADQATQALSGVLSLAQASGAGLAESAESMAASLSQFGLQASDSARVANVFAAAANTSLASMDKLTSGLRQVGPVAGTLGISIEEVTANLDALFNKGFQGEQAGTALRSILLDLVDPSSTVVAALEKQGVAYDKVNPKVVGLSGAFENMQKAGVDLTTVFGKVSAAEALALIDTAGKATGNLRDMQKEISGTNSAADAAAKMNDNLNGSLLTMQSQAEAASISFGETFSPALRGAVTVVGDLFAWIAKLPTPLLAVAGGLAVAATAVGGLSAAFRVLGIAATGALGPIGIAIGVITTAAGIAGTVVNNQKNVTANLNKVTNDLTTATSNYNSVQKEASDKANTLSESEKKVLDNRKELLHLEVEKQLNNLASSYDKTTKSIDSLNKKQEKEKQDLKDLQDWQQKVIDQFVSEGMSIEDAQKAAAKYNNMGKNIIKRQSKLTDTTNQLISAQTDLSSVINTVASMVAKGTLNIDWLKTANVGLYNAIMAAVPAMTLQSKEIDSVNTSVTTGVPELTKWQQALKDALNVKDISSGKNSVSEYIATTKSELNKAVDAAKTTGGDVAKVYSDYASKVNDAITSLIMSGQYVGSEATIQSLKDFADGLQKISDSFGATGNTGATDEQIKKFKEIGEEIKSLGNLSGDTFTSMKNYIIEDINNAGLLSDQVKELLQNLNDTKAATIDWGNYAEQAFEGALSSFSALGEAIATGDSVWSAFGAAALNAISSVLQGIGAELAIKAAEDYAMAASYASNPITAALAPGAIASGVKATAASAAAYTAAGLVTGWASSVASMATGGIVEPSSGGSLIRVAENNNEEGIFNAGQTGKPLIDSFTESMLKNMNNSGIGNQTIVLKLDSKEVTRVVTRRQRNKDY